VVEEGAYKFIYSSHLTLFLYDLFSSTNFMQSGLLQSNAFCFYFILYVKPSCLVLFLKFLFTFFNKIFSPTNIMQKCPPFINCFHQIYFYLLFMGSSYLVALFGFLRLKLQWNHNLLALYYYPHMFVISNLNKSSPITFHIQLWLIINKMIYYWPFKYVLLRSLSCHAFTHEFLYKIVLYLACITWDFSFTTRIPWQFI